jgi:hypothetical protein
MQQTNVHQQKLYALIEAGLGLVGLFLTWYTAGIEGMAQTNKSQNGMEDWGFLSLAGVAVVVFVSFLQGDKTKPFDDQSKKLAIAGFLAIALGAVITLLRLPSSNGQFQTQNGVITIKTTAGPGLYMTLVAGIIGILWVTGIINKLSAPQQQQQNTAVPPAAPTTTTNQPLV